MDFFEMSYSLFISVFRTVVGSIAGVCLMSMAAYALKIKNLPGKRSYYIFLEDGKCSVKGITVSSIKES